ncbi:class I SAM-dependent methyltransferase [Blastopirellula marina]|uniref:2-heptaprenyl-1,4-naphthoquinone methyltransferase n=1 Tax=Blastopirellula marina TaxID=124 RepID=A0A2S8G9P5_9BACT|nr:class I SAM-dependent methyltransferase [Blastopirellula marina]PQO41147.1 2-heptaprenyl-1,4-naphthoquinone methyltransferase [Blastopirellula marina]PTL46023.1 methyltransferase domain-containing protein [Blastopirellula marina]
MSTNPAKQFYDRISHVYDLIADGGEHKAREQGLSVLDVQEGETVLEIGYGTGNSVLELAKSVGPTGQVLGIDISKGMQEVARKKVKEAGFKDTVSLLIGAVPPLPFEDDSFDVVTMSFTLELFPLETIPTVLDECRRVLKPGGRLGVVSMATVEEGDKKSALEKTYIWMHTHFPHIVDCQPIPLEKMVQKAGFKLDKQERIDLFTMPVAIIVAT